MQPYFRLMRNRVYVPIAACLREYSGEADIKKAPLRELEVDLAKSVVEKIQYYGIRKWVYELPSLPPIEPLIEISVRGLLDGARAAVPEVSRQGKTLSARQQAMTVMLHFRTDAASNLGSGGTLPPFPTPHSPTTFLPGHHLALTSRAHRTAGADRRRP